MEHKDFLERVLARLPATTPTSFQFQSWSHAGRPTDEGFGICPVPGVDPEKLIDAVMAVDSYVGNVEHVAECRSISDSRFVPPEAVRFYQRVDIPVLGAVHHELVLHRMGEHGGYHVAAWHVLRSETDALSTKQGFRSDYNFGAWLVKPGVLGYALSSAPKRDDVGFLKWKALTKGADAAAGRVVKANIEGMARWAMSR
ncbi:MAG: hypothetical protein H6734_20115 [Alphaproteobacteria bacterium]|nr:hypothetical protein [Alphaproteobacteria bacterium]